MVHMHLTLQPGVFALQIVVDVGMLYEMLHEASQSNERKLSTRLVLATYPGSTVNPKYETLNSPALCFSFV